MIGKCQSLSGLWVRCDRRRGPLKAAMKKCQSLSGLWVRCDDSGLRAHILPLSVSIPIRALGPLRLPPSRPASIAICGPLLREPTRNTATRALKGTLSSLEKGLKPA